MDTLNIALGRLAASVTVLSGAQEDEGQTLVEYGLIIALIAVAAIAAMNFLGGSVNTVFSNVGSSL